MEYLINPGGTDDKNSIELAMSKGTRIRNWQRREQPVEALRDAARFATEGYNGRMLRSLTSRYNCVGMAFANRRTCIEPTEVPMILRDDEYVAVGRPSDVVPGDLVLYEDVDGISHVCGCGFQRTSAAGRRFYNSGHQPMGVRRRVLA